MKRTSFLILAVLTVFLVTLIFGTPGFSQSPPPPDVESLQEAANGKVEITWNSITKRPSFIRGDFQTYLPASESKVNLESVAMTFLGEHAMLFGLQNVSEELKLIRSEEDGLGMSHLTFQQVYRGIEVYGAHMKVHIKEGGSSIYALSNGSTPNVQVADTIPDVSAAQAIELANQEIPHGELIGEAQLAIYTHHNQIKASLAWFVELQDSTIPARNVYVIDADSGVLLDVLSRLYTESNIQPSDQFTDQTNPPQDPPITVSKVEQGNRLLIEFKTPAYEIQKNDLGFDQISMDGFNSSALPGYPILPTQVYNIALPPDVVLESIHMEVIDAEVVELAGQVHLGITPADLSDTGLEDGELNFNSSALIGANEDWVELQSIGQMRKWVIARLKYSPFQFDQESGKLSLVDSIKVAIDYDLNSISINSITKRDRVMDDEAQEMLANYDYAAQNWYQSEPGLHQINATYDYVIITTNAIESGSSKLADFITHKEYAGFNVLVVTEDDYGSLTGQAPNDTADKIRKWLQDHFISYGIEYVLLIGDPDPDDPRYLTDSVGDVPMKMCFPRRNLSYEESPTDYYYADLTGDWDKNANQYYGEYYGDYYGVSGGVDFTPEVYVGRIPQYDSSYTTLDNILQKIIDYETENNPQSWRKSVLLPMSFSIFDYDGAPLAEQMLDDFISANGYTDWTMYQQGSGACALNSTYSSDQELRGGTGVRDRWAANPYGVVVWWGHGSVTETAVGCDGCWDGILMASSYTAALSDDYPAHVFLNACNNGYPEYSTNLGYTLLQHGAISTVSASRPSWFNSGVGYGDFDGSTTNSGIAYEYSQRLVEANQSAGEAIFQSKASMTPEANTRLMNYYDFNLYGDPSTEVFNTHGYSCYPADTLVGETTDTGNNQTAGSTDQIETYFRGTTNYVNESGPEYAYEFTADATCPMNVILSEMDQDLDIFVLDNSAGSCNASKAIAAGDVSAAFNAVSGQTYYLLVDGYEGAVSDYTLDVRCTGGRYRMTFNAQNGAVLPGTLAKSEDITITVDTDIENAFNFTGNTYHYYTTTHGRDSYDDRGGTLISSVHFGSGYQNAFSLGELTAYGDEFPVKDVVAHEWTHSVIASSAGLEYRWQSGALNESFSDIFAAMVDRDNWLIGEDLPESFLGGDEALRDMADPPRFGQPDHTADWLETCEDYEGVHTNNGIMNKAYYLIATQITKDKAEQIFYRTLTTYLDTQSGFNDARAAALQSAVDLYGEGSAEVSGVLNGFNAVGIDGIWDAPQNYCSGVMIYLPTIYR